MKKRSVKRGVRVSSKKKIQPQKQTTKSLLSRLFKTEEKLLQEEKNIEKREDEILKLEKRELKNLSLEKKEEQKIENFEKQEIDELKNLEEIEKKIKKDVGPHPLKKVSKRDFIKSLIGAFGGVTVHYTFTYGVEIAEHLNAMRAHLLYLLALIIAVIFIYTAGFRQVTERKFLLFIPFRMLIIYFTAVLVSMITLILFYPHFGELTFVEKYIQVATVTLPAVVGACVADLVGKEGAE